MKAFDTPILREDGALIGPWRGPRQMLAEQTYEGHASIHDDATAQKLGFKGGTIEGPTHFSQFVPLGVDLWGDRFLAEGSISAHYRNPVFEGEEVRAVVRPTAGRDDHAVITMEKPDGTEVLAGSMGVGAGQPATALEIRLAELKPLADPVILKDVAVGDRTPRFAVTMGMDQHMGDLYPFSLAQKLARITEPSALYQSIIPVEMISVLLNHNARSHPFRSRGPAVGLFADQEIRLFAGPLEVGKTYEIEREIVGITGSRRTESMWVKTSVFAPGDDKLLATMLLNTATLKDSYEPYAREHAALYGEAANA